MVILLYTKQNPFKLPSIADAAWDERIVVNRGKEDLLRGEACGGVRDMRESSSVGGGAA